MPGGGQNDREAERWISAPAYPQGKTGQPSAFDGGFELLLYNHLAAQPSELPCRIADYNRWPGAGFSCGPSWGDSYGITPATLYGLPGAEIDLSFHRWDARFQVSNSSPANPKGLFSSGEHAQWTAGAGYTIHQGFRVGISAFRGPWLDNAVEPYLGSALGDFPSSGLGADIQWARGHWSANGEWGRFVFGYPRFEIAPTSNFGYVELKRTISPRWYSALRANVEVNDHPEDSTARSTTSFLPNRQSYELAAGFRPDRFQLLKVGYEWMNTDDGLKAHNNCFGIQLLTSINSISKAL